MLLRLRKLLCLTALALPTIAFAASSITGIVTNKTTNKPSAGDDVTLIRLAQGMQESTKTKTDSKGHFTLQIPDDGLHLVRITHDKANYFRPLEPGTQSVEIEVFNASAKVSGVTNEAQVMRIESDPGGNGLRVVENFFVKNESSPPMTQFSDKPFDFYLPEGAIVEGSAALAPGGMPVQAAPVPLGDTPNHYAFIFPIRPGETRFQTTYKLPYTGSLKFSPKAVSPTDTVAIILPKSMKFVAGPSSPYTGMGDEVDGQTFVARNVQPSQPLDFTLSGQGQLPRDTAATNAAATSSDRSAPPPNANDQSNLTPSEASARQRADNKPGVGLNNPLDSDGDLEPWSKYKWWIIGALGLVFAAGAGFMLKGGTPAAATPVPAATLPFNTPATGQTALLAALKEELFALETDRLAGHLDEPAYAEQKAALEVVLRRALKRTDSVPAAETESLTTNV